MLAASSSSSMAWEMGEVVFALCPCRDDGMNIHHFDLIAT